MNIIPFLSIVFSLSQQAGETSSFPFPFPRLVSLSLSPLSPFSLGQNVECKLCRWLFVMLFNYGSNEIFSSCCNMILYLCFLLSWWFNVLCCTGNWLQAAFWYGLVVHFRIYPIIYALPIILVLDPHFHQSGQKPVLNYWTAGQGKTAQKSSTYRYNLWTMLMKIVTRERVIFGLVSGIVFLAFTGLFFYLYGWAFLHEALLYHLTRTDPRHNFSVYFYHIYLHYENEISVIEKLISFLPQFMVQLVLIFFFAQDFPFCFFVQTVAFVAFNKVCLFVICFM